MHVRYLAWNRAVEQWSANEERCHNILFEFSAIIHLQRFPPLFLPHGKDDELAPFSQNIEADAEPTRLGMPREFYTYEGLSRCFSTSADSATTQQMLRCAGLCV